MYPISAETDGTDRVFEMLAYKIQMSGITQKKVYNIQNMAEV